MSSLDASPVRNVTCPKRSRANDFISKLLFVGLYYLRSYSTCLQGWLGHSRQATGWVPIIINYYDWSVTTNSALKVWEESDTIENLVDGITACVVSVKPGPTQPSIRHQVSLVHPYIFCPLAMRWSGHGTILMQCSFEVSKWYNGFQEGEILGDL